MVWSGAIWGVPKYVITNLKINNFKEKINTFKIYQGVWGAEDIFEKSNKMEAFPYLFFFTFL